MDLDVHLSSITAGDAHAFGRWLAGSERIVRDTLRSFAAVIDVEAVLQEALCGVAGGAAVRPTAARRPPAARDRIARNLAISEVRGCARSRRG
jgi:hypothetical protein